MALLTQKIDMFEAHPYQPGDEDGWAIYNKATAELICYVLNMDVPKEFDPSFAKDSMEKLVEQNPGVGLVPIVYNSVENTVDVVGKGLIVMLGQNGARFVINRADLIRDFVLVKASEQLSEEWEKKILGKPVLGGDKRYSH